MTQHNAPVSQAEKMKTHAIERREEMAKKVLDKKTVYAAIKQAATTGQRWVLILQKEHVDLSDTAHAKGLEKQLKKDRFSFQWKTATQRETITDPKTKRKEETRRTFDFKELYISW